MTDEIAFAVQNGVATILLNRPQALNALTHTMCVPLERHLRDWAKDPAVRAVIIKAAGDKAFCAGGDISKLADRGPDGTAYRDRKIGGEGRSVAVRVDTGGSRIIKKK